MQHDWTHVERPGESHTALDGKKRLDAARTWLQALNRPGMTPAPNPQQKQVLTAVVERCHAEAVEERADKQNRSEPFRAILHGVPGAGKSQTLHWLRTFFETVCDWQHLHEFAFVAPQNTQAALIDGITIHSFADIRVQGQKQKRRRLLDQITSSSTNIYAGLSSTNAAPQPWKYWPC